VFVRPIAPVLVLALTTGCYAGLPGAADTGDHAGTGPGADTDAATSGAADETGGTPSACAGEVQDVGPTPLRRLTRREYANAVEDLFGVVADVGVLDPDEKLAAFDSNLVAPVSPAIITQYRALAESVADAAVLELANLVPCAPEAAQNDPAIAASCTEAYLASVGRRAFRRPLTASELQSYGALASGGSDFADGIRLATGALLQSVHFLYHLELAPGDAAADLVALDDHQLAARLSFFLWGSVPDDDLLDAADAGELQDPVRLRAEAERMLATERAADAVQSFHMQWLGLDRRESMVKQPDVYPAFDEDLRAAMWRETEQFVAHVVLEGDGRLTSLMTSSESFIDGPLAELYGVTLPADHDPAVPIELDPAQRAGLLTQASFMAAHAHNDSSGPVQRGVIVRSNILCQPLPPPPNNVPELDPVDPDATTRERFEQHSSDPSYSGCHSLIDGIGLAMENYDGIGRHRTEENGLPVDASGNLLDTDVDGEFNGAVELAHKLADSEIVRDCVTVQWFRFAFGRGESEPDACTIDGLRAQFAASDGDVRELMLAIIASEAFRTQRLQ
jgi:hypothetical protein